MTQSKHYLCTRPTLAAMLISAGVPTQKTENPFASDNRHRSAWFTDLNQESAQIIADYFAGLGKPVPASVEAVLNGGVEVG